MICWFCRKQNVLFFSLRRYFYFILLRCLWFTCAVGTAATVATIQQFATPCTTVVVIIIIYIWFWHRVSWRQQQQQQITKSHSAQCHRACSKCSCICISTRLIQYLIKISGWPIWVFFARSFPCLCCLCQYVSAHFSCEVGCDNANVNWTTCNRVHVTPDRLKRATIQMTWSRGARVRHQRSFKRKNTVCVVN